MAPLAFNLLDELAKNFSALDIAHATQEQLLHYRMIGLSNAEEQEAIARVKKLEMLKDK